MTPLDLPSLVVIASQALGEDTQAVLGRLDVTAAQTALAEARPDSDGNDPAACAAGLLSALIQHRPLVRGNEVVAVAAMTTFLAVNGWQADLDPAGAFPALLTGLASGQLPGTDLTAWLSDHVFPSSGVPPGQAPTKEERMHGWLPGRRRPARKKGLFRRFTPEAREVVIGSQQEARRLGHNYIGTEHILLGLLRAGDGIAARALHAAGISREAARRQVLDIIGEGEQQPAGHIPFTPRAKKVLELALRESVSLGHMYIGSEHILLGLIREGSGLAAQILTSLGASSSQLRDQVLELLSSERPAAAGPTVPPRIREFDKKIARARQEKDAAIDARDFDRAAMLRDQEKDLVAERDRQIELWSTGADVAALGREVELLRAEVERLLEMLLQHGIDPSEHGQQTA